MSTEIASRRSFLVASGAIAGGSALVSSCARGYGDSRADANAQYLSAAEAGPQGTAPYARTHRLSGGAYMLVLRDGDELFTALNDFANAYHITAASFSAIGALRDVRVGWYDLHRKKYKVITVDGQVEAASIIGDIGTFGGKPVVHTHLVVARQDASTSAGHLLHAVTSPTIEVFIHTYPETLAKKADDATGLTLFD
ncbi:PPC domain-containing DNA-binding protein [Mycobacterium paraffinicum]|nr:PPC domain-containing DNA-binding protein [Mycobacterium paraffinicum]